MNIGQKRMEVFYEKNGTGIRMIHTIGILCEKMERHNTGLHTINGKQYYFSEYYVLSTNCIIRDGEDKIYYCDSDGVVTDVTDDGWVQNCKEKKYNVTFGDFLQKMALSR